ncbi:MAG: MaoC family dehydratase N-terminal domain-containing protein [Chloroflexi bacterium]|nr:MaoC family dehydratase N-terminal domain-containing protein [Chloroflexota bacterium]
MTTSGTKLTSEVKAVIGKTSEFSEAGWGVANKERNRRFTQAIMDPDPRYWDEDFAKTTRYREVIVPHLAGGGSGRAPWMTDDPVSWTFKENPVADGVRDAPVGRRRGGLPPVPTDLVRLLNAGNEIEMYKHPIMGDRMYSQSKYANIIERVGRDGSHMLIITTETYHWNQRGELCYINRGSSFRR